mmetsp:Transcript_24390/g.51747  ORF Transcript_24390/g.51747 Transcript_24390/m.51747 type:complete len:110 (-) Transcript_24390:30-359(-)
MFFASGEPDVLNDNFPVRIFVPDEYCWTDVFLGASAEEEAPLFFIIVDRLIHGLKLLLRSEVSQSIEQRFCYKDRKQQSVAVRMIIAKDDRSMVINVHSISIAMAINAK